MGAKGRRAESFPLPASAHRTFCGRSDPGGIRSSFRKDMYISLDNVLNDLF